MRHQVGHEADPVVLVLIIFAVSIMADFRCLPYRIAVAISATIQTWRPDLLGFKAMANGDDARQRWAGESRLLAALLWVDGRCEDTWRCRPVFSDWRLGEAEREAVFAWCSLMCDEDDHYDGIHGLGARRASDQPIVVL